MKKRFTLSTYTIWGAKGLVKFYEENFDCKQIGKIELNEDTTMYDIVFETEISSSGIFEA